MAGGDWNTAPERGSLENETLAAPETIKGMGALVLGKLDDREWFHRRNHLPAPQRLRLSPVPTERPPSV